MATVSRYAKASVQINSLPITEATSVEITETGTHKLVRTRGHQGVMAGVGPSMVKASFDCQIPRGAPEFDFLDALRTGVQVTLRWVDLDEILDCVGIFTEVAKTSPMDGDRSCKVSFEGSTVV